MTTMRAVTFRNADGHTLSGIVHEPRQPRTDLGVVLLPAGVKARVGPHRLYLQLASLFNELGFCVMRFDFHGLGDAEGVIAEPLLADFYGSVSLGRYVKDTEAAADWMCRNLGVDRVVVGGLCGGAITGLLAGSHPRVAALIGLGLPVSVDGSNVDKVRFMSTGQLEGIRSKYFRKLLDPGSWGRLLSFKTDYRLLVRSLLAPLGKRRQQTGNSWSDAQPVLEVTGNTNPYFRPAVLRMTSMNRPLLLVFSETDRLYSEFRERFVDTRGIDVNALSGALDVQVVPHANHIFTFGEWQNDMLGRIRAWMNARFPIDSRMSTTTRARAVGQ